MEHERSFQRTLNCYAILFSILLLATSWACLLLDPHSVLAQTSSASCQKLFFYFHGLAFFFSLCGLFIVVGSLNHFPLPHSSTASPATIYITALGAANLFAGLATASLGKKLAEQVALIMPCIMVGFVFLQEIVLFLNDVCVLRRKIRVSNHLREAMKGGPCLQLHWVGMRDYGNVKNTRLQNRPPV